MSKPKFFRDPVHLQLRFEDVPLTSKPDGADERAIRSWLLRRIIDDPNFQRLRSIRQNGLTNFVFHGAEHSRFSHSLGVCHLAGLMYEKIIRNCSDTVDETTCTQVMTAALLHDIGHGPFSHALEEIIRDSGKEFEHEDMTIRFVTEQDSSVSRILREYDNELPATIEAYFDKTKRVENAWKYRVVSSQMDADRIDYLYRDRLFAGVRGPVFDLERLLDLMYHHEGSIAVEIGALEAVESYLFTLDHMYRTVYYHHAVRAATRTLTSAVRRAVQLFQEGDTSIFPLVYPDGTNPLARLVSDGDKIPIELYGRLGEFTLWQHLELWRQSKDPHLADLSSRIVTRRPFKAIDVKETAYEKIDALVNKARNVATSLIEGLDEKTVGLYVIYEEPSRTGYRTYTWTPESSEESIWLVGEGIKPHPIETDSDSRVIEGLKAVRAFPRLIVPEEVRSALAK